VSSCHCQRLDVRVSCGCCSSPSDPLAAPRQGTRMRPPEQKGDGTMATARGAAAAAARPTGQLATGATAPMTHPPLHARAAQTWEELPLVLRARHIQEILGISKMRAYTLIGSGVFPVQHIGRAIRVPRETFRAWLEAQH